MLLLRSYSNVTKVDAGVRADTVTSLQLTLTNTQYRDLSERIAFLDGSLRRIRSLPSVRSAGVASRLPLNGQVGGTILTAEGTNVPRLERPIVSLAITDSAYFKTIGIPFISGRPFDDNIRGHKAVAIVSAAVARRVWGERDPIGRRFRLGPDSGSFLEVVGVVGSVHGLSLTDPPTLDVYVPYWQDDVALFSDRLFLAVQPSSGPTEAASQVRTVLRQLDPSLPLPAFRTFAEITEDSIVQRRFLKNVALIMALCGALLACIGIFGVVSQVATERTKEMGIRRALGAPVGSVEWLILMQVAVPVLSGLVLGAVMTVLLASVLRSLLFGTPASDPASIVVASALLSIVSGLAAYVPARRVGRVDPLAVLRAE
jgi:predicted permease